MIVSILATVAVLGGLGLLFGLVLAVASNIFAVEEDPRKEKLMEQMPGANCGACGYAGCAAYADAVVGGNAPVGICPVGGAALAEKMAHIMGVADVGPMIRQVALVKCSGHCTTLYKYEGPPDCLSASRMAAGGPSSCSFGCLGFGNCAKACNYGALTVVDGNAKVDPERCVGCMKCIAACPKNLITLVPFGSEVTICCSSYAKGAETKKSCDRGCLGCGLCARFCPSGAITIANNLATIDYTKCTSCGTCVAKCPQHLIVRTDNFPQTLDEVI